MMSKCPPKPAKSPLSRFMGPWPIYGPRAGAHYVLVRTDFGGSKSIFLYPAGQLTKSPLSRF